MKGGGTRKARTKREKKGIKEFIVKPTTAAS